MTEKERELLLAWIVNEESRLENDVVIARHRVRWSHPDQGDIFELLAALQRYDDFKEFALIVIRLLNLDR